MAKKPKQNKPSWFSSVFYNIKNFFTNLVRGIAGKITGIFRSNSAEERPENFQIDDRYRNSDEIAERYANPPGFDELQLEHESYVKIPRGTEKIWHVMNEQDAQKYIDEIHSRCAGIGLPEENHHGEFISAITKGLAKQAEQMQDRFDLCVVGNTLIATRIKDGEISFTLYTKNETQVNNKTEPTIDIYKVQVTDHHKIRETLANAYVKATCNGERIKAFTDTNNKTSYLFARNGNENNYDTYIARQVNINTQRKNSHGEAAPEVLVTKITGPYLLPHDMLFPIGPSLDPNTPQPTDAEYKEQIRCLAKELWGKIPKDPTQPIRPTTYATHKEFVWLSSDENNIYINAAPRDCDPAKCPTQAQIQVPITDIQAALAESKPDWRFFTKAVRNAIAAADAHAAPIRKAREKEAEEERRAKEETDKQRAKEHQDKLKKADAYKAFLETPQHVTFDSVDDIQAMIVEAMSGINKALPNGRDASHIQLTYGEHTLEIYGILYDKGYELPAYGCSIELDGKLLFENDSRSDGPYHKVESHNGSYNSAQEACQEIFNTYGTVTWTRTGLELTAQNIDDINTLVQEGYLDPQSLKLPPDRKQDLVNAGLYPEEQELPDDIDDR